jgi:hypothetical protein
VAGDRRRGGTGAEGIGGEPRVLASRGAREQPDPGPGKPRAGETLKTSRGGIGGYLLAARCGVVEPARRRGGRWWPAVGLRSRGCGREDGGGERGRESGSKCFEIGKGATRVETNAEGIGKRKKWEGIKGRKGTAEERR